MRDARSEVADLLAVIGEYLRDIVERDLLGHEGMYVRTESAQIAVRLTARDEGRETRGALTFDRG